MIWLLIVFCVLLLSPFLLALWYFKTKKGGILSIDQDYKRDARYFGRSFAEKVEAALPDIRDGIIHISKEEPVLEIQEGQVLETQEIKDLVVAYAKEFCPKGKNLCFAKEIYCGGDGRFTEENIKMRSVYAKGRLLLGNGTDLVRWADAEGTVAVYDHCQLGRSVSSEKLLVLGFDNTFHRLFAPHIRIGQRPCDQDVFQKKYNPEIFLLRVMEDRQYDWSYIDEEHADETGKVPYTIVTRSDIRLLEGMILQGDIHSDKSVRIMERGIVVGNIFAEENILLEKDAIVFGNVFSQGDIFLEKGACVGHSGKVSSMIARGKIEFSGENDVFGYVSSEAGGYILPAQDREGEDYHYPEEMPCVDHIKFNSLEEYEKSDPQGYRLNPNIKYVEIPDGATNIPSSQFFGCSALETAVLSETICAIGAYTFADCIKMELNGNLEKMPLRSVGISAFENCRKLTFEKLPQTLQVIEGAAFAGCSSIEKIIFPNMAELKKIGAHAFRDCQNLTEVYLPDQVQSIGVSAFAGCSSLKTICLPETVSQEPGILQLVQKYPQVELVFRKLENRVAG